MTNTNTYNNGERYNVSIINDYVVVEENYFYDINKAKEFFIKSVENIKKQ